MSIKFSSSLSNLLFLIEAAIIEFELLHQEQIKGFTVQAVRCLIREEDLNLVNKYFVVIVDKFGPHCIDFIVSYDYVQERFEYWKRFIQLGRRKVVEYSFPNIFPVRVWELNRGEDETKEK